MRVLLLPSWYTDENNPLRGIFFKEQAEALEKSGVEVIVLSITLNDIRKYFKGEIKKGLEISIENGVKVYRYNTFNYFPKLQEFYFKYYSKLINKLVKLIVENEGDIDIVHIHSALDAGISYSLSKVKLPYVITEHSSKYARNMLNPTQKKYLPKAFNGAEVVIAVGEGLKKSISKYSNSKKIKIIPNLVKMPNVDFIKEESNLENKKIKLFSLGFLTHNKGMDLIIEAYNLGKDKLKDVQIFIGGSGSEFENLKNLIIKYKLEDNIILLGELNREEVAKNMEACDAFILSSRHETFGIVFIEAMYYGKPVIASKTGGIETFIDEKCGILVESGNVNEIKNAMINMKEKYYKYDNEFIKDFCKKNFSEEVIANELISLYRKVISENVT